MSSAFAVASTGVDVPGEVSEGLTSGDVAVRLVRNDATPIGPLGSSSCARR